MPLCLVKESRGYNRRLSLLLPSHNRDRTLSLALFFLIHYEKKYSIVRTLSHPFFYDDQAEIESRILTTDTYSFVRVINPVCHPVVRGKRVVQPPFSYVSDVSSQEGEGGRRFTPVTVEHFFHLGGVFFASIHPVTPLFSPSFFQEEI